MPGYISTAHLVILVRWTGFDMFDGPSEAGKFRPALDTHGRPAHHLGLLLVCKLDSRPSTHRRPGYRGFIRRPPLLLHGKKWVIEFESKRDSSPVGPVDVRCVETTELVTHRAALPRPVPEDDQTPEPGI
jgi:hypothetical protein